MNVSNEDIYLLCLMHR